MLEKSLNTLLYKAILASVEAGKEILKIYDTAFDVEYKSDDTPLTQADQNASDKIIELLADTNITVLSEEGEHFIYEKRKLLNELWIIDPLDGTKEFVKRNGEFTVNIALVKNNKSVLGVIYSPVFKDLYFAAEGIGSFKINRHDLIPILNDLNNFTLDRLISIAKKLPLNSYPEVYTLVASRSHLSKEIYAYIEEQKLKHGDVNIVNTGSSIKMCWVAEGLANEYPRFGPTMEWDTAAGQAILENAGCELIDLSTKQAMQYNREELRNNSFIARQKS
jgi:3'(2'), 5'-bisphosphate nucleotidase